MALFPMFIDLEGKTCLVFGGGQVALRKVRSLMKFGADLLVCAPEICEEIRSCLKPDRCLCREMDPASTEELLKELAADAVLCIAATSHREVNHTIAAFCQDRKIPVNVADAPEECTFVFPAVVVRDGISVGISSSGASPGFSGIIRRQIEETVPEWYGQAAEKIGGLRNYLKEHYTDEDFRRGVLCDATSVSFDKKRALTDKELSDIISLHLKEEKGQS